MRILYIQYTNPAAYPPLEHSSRIFADAGWQVLFLGTASEGASDLRFDPHANIRLRLVPFCAPGLLQKLHYLLFCVWVLAWATYWRPRWIYASEELSCPIALLLAFIPGLHVVYHEHDSPDAGGTSTPVRRARRALAKRAVCCVLPNSVRAERFRIETGAVAVQCVWNCPRIGEVAAPRAPADLDDIWILYHGSIVPSRLPLSIVTTLSRLPSSVKLRVLGYETKGSVGYLQIIRDRARELGVRGRIELVGTVPTRADLFAYCMRSDIGLALMPIESDDFNMQTMTGASNKAFDYLACGLAVVVSDLPSWKDLYVAPGYGVACQPEDPASIEKVLRSLIEQPQVMRNMGERGRQRIVQDWNYETQFKHVFDRLNATTAAQTLSKGERTFVA